MEDSGTGFEGDSLRSYDEIIRLERNLLAASKAKGPFDPSVRRLRTSIRDSYEALILHDHALAESLEIEQALWRLHYREIEGFRGRIRKLLEAKVAHEDAVEGRGRKRKKSNRQEPLLRLLTALKSFLGEATGFFHGLLIKIRLRNGLTSIFGDTERLDGENMRDELRCCMVSCHRLLIYLGDLARYKELYVVLNPVARDWSVAANHYKQAAYFWPASGHPYNQLAVLCSYTGDDLMSLYLYCRSLAVNEPFTTAWDNLSLLFEKNKQRIAQASLLRSKSDLSNVCGTKQPTCLRNLVVEQDSWSTEEVASSCGWVVMHFVKLVGILLTQSSTEDLEEVVELIQKDLERFIYAQFDLAFHMKKSLRVEDSPPLALQVNVTLIFCMHHIIRLQSTIDQEHLLSITLKFALKFAALSLGAAAKPKMCSIFPVAVIFMEWLASEPKALQIVGEKSIEVDFTEFCEKIMAFDTTLITKTLGDDLPEDKNIFRVKDKDDLLEVSDKAEWQDHELLGFIPLASTHLNLDFSKQLTWDGNFDFARYLCWKLRYTAALQKVNKTYQESTANDVSSGKKESSLVSSFEADHVKPTADNSLVVVHPVPSLKEWVEKSCFPTDVLCNSAFTKQLEVQCSGIGKGEHDVVGSASEPVFGVGHNLVEVNSQINVVSMLGASNELIVQSAEFVSEDLKCTDKQLSIDTQQAALSRSEIRMDEVPLANQNAILVSPTSTCRYGEGQLITNPSHISECCFPCSSVMLKSKNSPKKVQRQETESFSVPFREPVKNPGMELPRKSTVVSLVSQENPIENRTCFDNFTHVKPEQYMEAPPGSRSSHSLRVGLRKKETASTTYSKLHIWRQKSYVTQNPFVLRIKEWVDG